MEKSNECGDGGRSMMDEFDDNILTEILLRVPMNMKFRCRAVCKRWFHLISNPSFAQLVLGTLSSSTPWFLLYQYYLGDLSCPTDDGLTILSADGFNDHTLMLSSRFWDTNTHSVYATHNGLVLSCDSRKKLYVGNPLTGKWVTLPDPQIDCLKLVGFIVSCSIGNNKFKVVRVTHDCLNFEVFSSDVGEWRDTGVAVPETDGSGYFQGFSGVVHDGKLHWRAGTVTDSLMVYDPDKNECRVFSFNLPLSVKFKAGLMGVSCGHLCYANCASNYEEDLYVVENYEGEEWRPLMMTKMRIVLEVNEDEGWNSMMPLAFHPFNKDIVYFNMWNGREGKIVSLNVGTKKLVSLTGEEIQEGYFVKWPICVYEIPPWPTSVPH